MKRLYDFLNIAVWSCVGVLIGSGVYTWFDYQNRPGLYAMRSAPWYAGIVTYGAFTAVAVAALLLLRRAICRKMKW